ncbi:MAG: hypothetical protein ACFE8V_09890 [Promethearchaeota archaeon]
MSERKKSLGGLFLIVVGSIILFIALFLIPTDIGLGFPYFFGIGCGIFLIAFRLVVVLYYLIKK